jgi:hypothetical protein
VLALELRRRKEHGCMRPATCTSILPRLIRWLCAHYWSPLFLGTL